MANHIQNSTVYKSNALIEANYRLSVAEQRIILTAISQIRHDQPVTDEIMYSVQALDIAEAADIAPPDAYRDLKEAAERLHERKVRIIEEPNTGKRKPKVMVTNWVQTVVYIDGEGRVELRFSKDILPYLTDLRERFTRYHLTNVVKLNSSHAIRLYELLTQWRSVGEREVSIDWLREAFDLEDAYPSIKDFKKRVIEPAVTQISAHSNLKVTWTQRKTGRRVTHLTFHFAEKKPKSQARKSHETGNRINGVPKSLIEKLARPGETYEQAAVRIRSEQAH